MNSLCFSSLVVLAISAVASSGPCASGRQNELSRLQEVLQHSPQPAAEDSRALMTPVKGSNRQPRTFSPVQILNLPQPTCRYDSDRNGTCMPGTLCVAAGGKSKVDSLCNPARGAFVATCCLLEQTCGGVIRRNNTYFVNPNFPEDTTTPQTCDVVVAAKAISPKACFLRLDLKNFTIHDPMDGKCQVDEFYAPQLDAFVPKLCGYNNQSHFYTYVKDISQFQNITLRFNLGNWRGGRHWMVNVAVINCGEDWTPPSRGCFQYMFNAKDSIRSFNFHEHNPDKSALIAGLHYTVCIRQEPTKCLTKWTSDFFSMTKSNQSTGVGDSCQKSYVAISQGFNYLKQNATYDRFCGEVFGSENNSTNSSAVYSAAVPFNVQVRQSSDAKSLGKGFLLKYEQLQCGQFRSSDSGIGGFLSWLASFLPNFITGRSNPPTSTELLEIIKRAEES